MACIVTCDNCSKTYRAEPEFVGSLWAQVLSFNCPFCGATSTSALPPTSVFDGAQVKPNRDKEEGGLVLNLGAPASRLADGQSYEMYVQKYFQESCAHYGFSSVSEPRRRGPDFEGVLAESSESVLIEVECTYQSYLKHGHHTDRNFSKVKYLFVLEQSPPNKEVRKSLPKNIIVADLNHFLEWYFTSIRSEHADGIRQMLAMEFNNIYVERCSDKERDMAICPNCRDCAYFDAQAGFDGMAALYTVIHHAKILNPNFRWQELDRESLVSVYEAVSQVNPRNPMILKDGED